MHLSPDYGLSLIRLATTGGRGDWPGLLLHSAQPVWPFDPQATRIEDHAGNAPFAAAASLHLIDDPFNGHEVTLDVPWAFWLPSQTRGARLVTFSGVVQLTRTPNITDEWWGMSVIRQRQCRLLIAVGADFTGDPETLAATLNATAAAGRLAGGTIDVEQP